MIRYAANLSLLFTEWPFDDRFDAACDAGFEAVEFSFPLGSSAINVVENLRRTGLRQVLASVPLRPGGKGLAAIAGQATESKDDFLLGLEYAVAGGSPLLHVLSGVVDLASYEVSCEVFEERMSWAIEQAARLNVKLVIEAINRISVPNYFIRSLTDTVQWTQRLDGLGLILDLHHASMEELDPLECIRLHLPRADHLQIASFPGMHEPDMDSLCMQGVVD